MADDCNNLLLTNLAYVFIPRQHSHVQKESEQKVAKVEQLDRDLDGAGKDLEEISSKKNAAKKELQTIKNQLKGKER